MRIISGTARGRQLANFSGTGIRPTPDRVREAVFSILQSRLGSFSGLNVLELFAGTGAQSLEAISRGADSATLIDSSRQSVDLIRENIQRCKFNEQVKVINKDVLKGLHQVKGPGCFDLILLDPPYNKELIPQTLELIDSLQLLGEDGIICAESATNETISSVGRLHLNESRKYGSTTIHLFSFDED
jgi:16S rRNA (guanine(966)-N(2))-methyltransferase RsmD